MESQTTKLAEFFNKQRELIEAAETPFAKLAVFVLPLLSPFVPALFTGMHLYQLFLELFDFSGARGLAFVASAIPALVLELLGYVGAISFIQALFKWIESRQNEDGDKFLVPAILNFLAYIFYLTAMYLINVSLGNYFGTPPIVNSIIGLLSFITVPTSLLAANHLAIREHEDKKEKIRQEKREDKIKSKMIANNMNPMATYQSVSPAPVIEEKPKGKSDWRLLTPQEKYEVVNLLSVSQIMMKYPIKKSTAYLWKSTKL